MAMDSQSSRYVAADDFMSPMGRSRYILTGMNFKLLPTPSDVWPQCLSNHLWVQCLPTRAPQVRICVTREMHHENSPLSSVPAALPLPNRGFLGLRDLPLCHNAKCTAC